MGIGRPVEAFQGSWSSKRYFEGWYFKQVSQDTQGVWSFIPGVSLTKEPFAFVQALNGISGEAYFYRYPLDSVDFSKKSMTLRVGNSTFDQNGMVLDLGAQGNQGPRIEGSISFGPLRPWKSSPLAPGIMGPFSYVPAMECKHGLVSMHHGLGGSLRIDQKPLSFEGGHGYIEKDWGISFPKTWLWVQCNTFLGTDKPVSMMLSVAVIPWMGRTFVGHLGFVMVGELVIPMATWNGSRIINFERTDESTVQLDLAVKDYTLRIVATSNTGGLLKAPNLGHMDALIKETINGTVALTLGTRAGAVLLHAEGTRAGMELMDGIQEAWEQDRS